MHSKAQLLVNARSVWSVQVRMAYPYFLKLSMPWHRVKSSIANTIQVVGSD